MDHNNTVNIGKITRMNDKENEHLEKIKRLKFLNDFLIFFGRDKIGFKELTEKKHYTFKFLEKEILDIHETLEGKEYDTIEGREKKYKSLAKVDLKRFAELMKKSLMEFKTILKEIDINDPKFRNIEVYLIPKKENLQKVVEVKKKTIVIKEEIMEKPISVSMKNLIDYDFQLALFSLENKEYCLFQIDGKYFLLNVDDYKNWIENILTFFSAKSLNNS